ncbi:MarR family winged helix-turn-helix transcriptional regulator [Brucella pituitosa]|uniref:MarR family winged helix-turn-helix transcriptional regulator n=1 Tax=Brucella pituitosa TaxID=571256 RepID=UPI0009A16B10|nr:MarR family winged helix-turn-helix transcriptional regulator [Brucella pituitosa]
MTPDSDILTLTNYQSLAKFRHYLRRFMSFSTAAAEAEGLPTQQHQALLAIKANTEDGAITVGTLAEWLVIAPHTATELVGRLVAADLVVREVDPDDRRRHRLILTTKAEDTLTRLTAAHLAEMRDLAPDLIAVLQQLAIAADSDHQTI